MHKDRKEFAKFLKSNYFLRHCFCDKDYEDWSVQQDSCIGWFLNQWEQQDEPQHNDNDNRDNNDEQTHNDGNQEAQEENEEAVALRKEINYLLVANAMGRGEAAASREDSKRLVLPLTGTVHERSGITEEQKMSLRFLMLRVSIPVWLELRTKKKPN